MIIKKAIYNHIAVLNIKTIQFYSQDEANQTDSKQASIY